MVLLDAITEPADLAGLEPDELAGLATEIRQLLVRTVGERGGHLGSNLGLVEITIALHRVFASPADRILFDTGHQAYVHKLLTGRGACFDTLRQKDGLSGYPSRAESEHDLIENSHASTALSYADGLAKAQRLRGESQRTIVAVVGDGALTGGMAWEALNNIGAAGDLPVVIVLNDNGRSYSPTVGGVARHLAQLRTAPRAAAPPESGIVPRTVFENLGLAYLGPVDGQDEQAVEAALRLARDRRAPVVVHCVTRKGAGYAPAENDPEKCYHSPGPFDQVTGERSARAEGSWTQLFSRELLEIARQRDDVVALTAAMLYPTGLDAFQRAFPGRVFDVGIAEQHAITCAAGLAFGGLHPVVAIYSTFLSRGFDQLLMDVALHELPITFALDRAGITGDDGPSHHGMWDMAMLRAVPGLRVAAPRDGPRLGELLREAVSVTSGPTALRFPKGLVPPAAEAVRRLDGIDVLAEADRPDLLMVAVGPTAASCLAAARLLAEAGIAVTVVDPRWVKPVSKSLVTLAEQYEKVLVVEDGVIAGGVGDAIRHALSECVGDGRVRSAGIPHRFIPHARREHILREIGLHPQGLAVLAQEIVNRRATAKIR